MKSHTVTSDNLAPADDLRVPEWVHMAEVPPSTDDEPWATVPARLIDASDDGYRSGLRDGAWLGIVLLAMVAIVAFAAGWLVRGAS